MAAGRQGLAAGHQQSDARIGKAEGGAELHGLDAGEPSGRARAREDEAALAAEALGHRPRRGGNGGQSGAQAIDGTTLPLPERFEHIPVGPDVQPAIAVIDSLGPLHREGFTSSDIRLVS